MQIALFLDRDGTLIRHIPYLSDPDQVELIPGVKKALHRALSAGYYLFLFTNQSGVGRGWFRLEDVHACNARMLELLDLPAPGFREICIAPEHPEALQIYRKPSPRFILEMIKRYHLDPENCYMLGDSAVDMEAARFASIQPIAVEGLAEGAKGAHCARTVASFIDSLLGPLPSSKSQCE